TGAYTAMGSATPIFITVGGGDILFNDPLLVTQYGNAATYQGQTAWGTFTAPLARVSNLSDAGAFNSLANITTRPLSALTGRTADNLTYVAGGATVESLRPGEAGANVTEGRTAAAIVGQGDLALADAVTWNSQVAGRPPELVDGRIAAGLTSAGKAVAVSVPDVRATNAPPSFYWAKGAGVYHEFKERAVIGAPGSATYTQLETRVPYPDASGGLIVQVAASQDGVYQRRAQSTSIWGVWIKSYDQLNRPLFGADLLESGGAVATDANYKTGLGVAAAITGQAPTATDSSFGAITAVPGRLSAHPVFGANYLPASAMLKDGSAGHDLQSWWPQDVGSNKTETRTAAAIVGQSLLARDPSFGNVTAVPARLSAHPTFGVGFLNTNLVLYSDGNNIQSFKPAEAGANVTETRTAAAIQGQSLLATNPDFAGVTGATRPSDNAGTSGILTSIGAHSVVFGNTVRKMGGTHGAFQGGAVGAAQKGSAFISASLLSAIAGGGWSTYLALDASPTNFNEPSATYACV
ncbi:MAG: hypothetical protein Q8R97_02780, partial [Brevundimonas sp.]|nr:hypothetical protein [Brevundimonas sp.]